MSSQSIPEERVYTYADFQNNFVKIYKEKYKLKKNGIVFIGNSRIGKSTLSCILANIKMKVGKNQYSQVFLEPIDPKYKQAIKHTKKSVTEIPNVYDYKMDNEQYSIVDLPGFLDSSYFRQICNLHYIKTILNSLQKICFVMVIEIHNKEKIMVQKELKMMDRFYTMFPEAASNTIIVVNNLNSNVDQNEKNKIFQNLSKQIGESDISKDAAKKKFFIQILKNSKFQYIKKINLESDQDPQESIQKMHNQMQKFIKNNKKHMKQMGQIKYQIKFDELQTQTKKIKLLLQEIVRKSAKNIEQSIKVLIKSFELSVDCYDKKQKIQSFKIQNILKDFIQKNKTDQQYDVLEKIRHELLVQIFHKKQNKLLNQALQVEDSFFEIYNELYDYLEGNNILEKVMSKLKVLVFRLFLILPQCKKQLEIIIMYLINKSQELQFLEKSVYDYQTQVDQFSKIIIEVKSDLQLPLKSIQKTILQKLSKIANKSLNKLQNLLQVGNEKKFEEKRFKINILITYSKYSENKTLYERLQIVYFKLYFQEILLIDMHRIQTDEMHQKIFQRNVNSISEYLLPGHQSKTVDKGKRDIIQKWRKSDKANKKIWKILQLKVYQKFAQYLTIHQNYNDTLQCYQHLRGYHQEIFQLVMSKWSTKNLDQKHSKYEKLMNISQKLLQSCRFDLALQCYLECSKLLRDQYDEDSVQKYRIAQNKIKEHYKNMSNLNKDKSYQTFINNYQKKLAQQKLDLQQLVSQQEFLDKLQKVQKITQIVFNKRSAKSSPQKQHKIHDRDRNITNMVGSYSYSASVVQQNSQEVSFTKLNKKNPSQKVELLITKQMSIQVDQSLNEKQEKKQIKQKEGKNLKQKKQRQRQRQRQKQKQKEKQKQINKNVKKQDQQKKPASSSTTLNDLLKKVEPPATQRTRKTFDFSKFGKN